MKNILFTFALLCSTSLVAQFRYHVLSNGQTRSGIESHDNNASGNWSFAVGQASEASGDSSTAMGFSIAASGDFSTAMGYASSASGTASTAIGKQSFATADYSTAIGYQASAIEDYSTAIGFLAIAKGEFSTAMGMYTKAEDYASTAIGHYNYDLTPNPFEFSPQNTAFIIGNGTDNDNRSNAFEVLFDGTTTIAGNITAPAFIGDGSQLTNMPLSFNDNGFGIQSATNTASGLSSFATGYQTTASGLFSTATGENTTASGANSTAMGEGTIAEDYISFAIGTYNKNDETPNPETFSYQNTAFVIGNGGYDNQGNWLGGADETRSNAFEVLFDGTTTIAGDLNINSDARLKANIISLGATLSKLLQIDGKTYTMKKDANHKKKIGLLAQDIEKVFPELVTETNDIKSVNYQGLVPVLINAMKEQDDKITKQQQEIERLKKQEAILNKQQKKIDELEAMVKLLANR